MNRITIGVDPGQTGALCVLHDGEFFRFFDMPVMPRPSSGKRKTQQINGAALAAFIRETAAREPGADVLFCVEAVSAMPSQGSVSGFHFGEGFGVLQGVIAALGHRIMLVHPSVWKKACGLSGQEKDVARTLAIQQCPAAASFLTRIKDGGRGDSWWLARHGYKNWHN